MNYGKVLVVDDNEHQLELIASCLRREGYEVETSLNPHNALDRVYAFRPELVVLDVMMPGMDGLTLCREIRHRSPVPILMCSARKDDVDRIVGLEVGADDYLTKPFNPRELAARVRAIFRRRQLDAICQDPVIVEGEFRIDVAAHEVEVGGRPVDLTPIEFALLRALAGNAGRVMTRQALLDQAWGREFVGSERTVDSHIRNLRSKLRAVAPGAEHIRAVRGVGYKFE